VILELSEAVYRWAERTARTTEGTMEAALVVDRPCGEYSLPGVLCGGHRGVKHGYEPVAEELRHGAVMAMHLVQGALEKRCSTAWRSSGSSRSALQLCGLDIPRQMSHSGIAISTLRRKMEFQRRFLPISKHSFFLFGPRETGKSTWLRHLFPEALFVGG
jgi:hypothetical protein